MSTQRTLLALAAGVFIGAAAGILFAPEKGEVIRGKIRDKSGDAADKFERKFNETKGAIRDKFKHEADAVGNAAKKAAKAAKAAG